LILQKCQLQTGLGGGRMAVQSTRPLQRQNDGASQPRFDSQCWRRKI